MARFPLRLRYWNWQILVACWVQKYWQGDGIKAWKQPMTALKLNPHEQWPKPWLFAVYRGLYYLVTRDYNKPLQGSLLSNVYNGNVTRVLNVAHMNLICLKFGFFSNSDTVGQLFCGVHVTFLSGVVVGVSVTHWPNNSGYIATGCCVFVMNKLSCRDNKLAKGLRY